eukprot:8694496-Pyramimonas_sp.AAC.1
MSRVAPVPLGGAPAELVDLERPPSEEVPPLLGRHRGSWRAWGRARGARGTRIMLWRWFQMRRKWRHRKRKPA